jgi:hypothetical protein
MAVMPTFLGRIIVEGVIRGDALSAYVIMGFMVAGMVVVATDALARKGLLDQGRVDAGWDRAEQRYSPAGYARRIREMHRRTFPLAACQRGAVGKDIMVCRAGQGRQGGRKRQGGSPAKKAAADDGGEPGEPPYQVLACTSDQHHQSFFSFQSAARILDCSAKTLRNKVSAGLIPAPIQTAIGPRFTAGQIQLLITPPAAPSLDAPSRPRGRPRIAQPKKLVTSSHGGDK